MKAIFILDMPETCLDCCFNPDNFGCVAGANSIAVYTLSDEPRRSEYCPLRPLPERKVYDGELFLDDEYVDGWNACLDAIGGAE